MKTFFRLVVFLIFELMTSVSWSIEPMDLEATSQVISKLEKAVPLLKEDTVKGASLIARIADLYAERGRKKFILEIEKNCKNCMGSREDRLQAIVYYKKLLKSSSKIQKRQRALFQIAHLQRLTGQDRAAERLFLKAIRYSTKKDKILRAEAHAGLVEIYYIRGQFSKSLKHANLALKSKKLKQPGLVMYRKAWSLLNTGKTQSARKTLIAILKNPQLLTIQTSEGPFLDESFQEDIARDLALFLARGKVQTKEVKLLVELSPSTKMFDNLFYLGQELSRVGAYQSALMVWAQVLKSNSITPDQQLEIKVRKAQLHLTAGQPLSAAKSLEVSAKHWTDKKCKDKIDCESLRIRFKNTVINWHKHSGKRVTKSLLRGYQAYSSVFVKDSDMHFRGAQVAQSLKQYSQSQKMFRLASETAKDKQNKGPAFEAALVGEIEVAESSKSFKAKQEAYEHYLKKNANGKKAIEVHYQVAHLNNHKKQYQKAADGFFFVANSKGTKYRGLKAKAADLTIDSLVLAKNHKQIERRAVELAKLNPKRRVEFISHARKASLVLVKKVLDSKEARLEDFQQAEQRIKNIPFAGVTKKEQIQIAKAKIIINEKLKDVKGMLASAKQLYSIKGLSESDNDYALEYIAWAYELKLQFKQAYKYAKKRKLSHLAKAERSLLLAMLAELAGVESRHYYKKFIKDTRSRQRANAIRAKLIKESKRPWNDFERESASLRYSPEVHSQLLLEVFAKNKNYNRLAKQLKNRRLKYGVTGQRLRRHMFLKDYNPISLKIKKHKLFTNSQYLLKKSIIKRMSLLKDLEQQANKAIDSKDWLLQLITLENVRSENARIAKELHTIPMPKGLNKQQKRDFKTLLNKKIAPFIAKKESIAKKTKTFWNNDDVFENLKREFVNASINIRGLISYEIKGLLNAAPKSQKSDLKKILQANAKMPSQKEVGQAWKQVKDDPFDIDKLLSLKNLEEERRSYTTIAYLDIRKTKMNKGGQR